MPRCYDNGRGDYIVGEKLSPSSMVGRDLNVPCFVAVMLPYLASYDFMLIFYLCSLKLLSFVI